MNSNIKYFTKPKFPDFDYLVSHVNWKSFPWPVTGGMQSIGKEGMTDKKKIEAVSLVNIVRMLVFCDLIIPLKLEWVPTNIGTMHDMAWILPGAHVIW